MHSGQFYPVGKAGDTPAPVIKLKHFPELIDFSKHSNREINYFAGTATYQNIVNIESVLLEKGQKIILNLGEMNDIAKVKVNGENLGVLWYPPYYVDITGALKKGEKMGRAMLAYPDWFIKNEPRPSQGRKTFSICYYYRTDSQLKPAGLVGPVRLITESVIPL